MQIIIDADASPVKDIAISLAERSGLEVVLVSSVAHHSNKSLPDFVSHIYVDSGADAADYKIVALAQSGDIVITQDYGLAALLLPKGCVVVHHKGFEYTDKNINNMLETRHMSSVIRRGGGRVKGPKPFTSVDKRVFHEFLEGLLVGHVEN
ncbi:YaiI/YqxD family protein [Aliicoccus persicus]|uniref:UPF0178 protein SAMN05192557_1833 n=1 Tax=Aliicoccus persicus TaxID=930138 RepID=A0A662Z6B1_9STAP|nr:YaiI/YqxD family protein [Aliicoccus persicus]SEW14881.1 hypothetical protein SAMN05192557_1833 [Aliicoccus persicus]